MYICSQNLLSVSLSEYSRGNYNGNRSVSCHFMSDIEYSVIKNDVIKSFDCIMSKKISSIFHVSTGP